MGLKCGIVGLPNVGKSTLFNALTSSKAEAANYPFCTIDPNVGVVTVPDERLEKISNFVKPQNQVPTVIEFVDIAGIVAGASQGEGSEIQQEIKEDERIVRRYKPLPQGFAFIGLIACLIAAFLGFLIMLGIAWWRGWLR